MGTPVTVTFVPEQVVTWLIIGLIAGYLASLLVRGRAGDAQYSILVGLLGAVFGGFLFSILGIQVPQDLLNGFTLRYIDIIIAFIGAVLVLFVFGAVRRRRG
ncbi:MAG: GlsB/YeaQ/YmgE family stress response membrane protein [Anaerolineae bacterium]